MSGHATLSRRDLLRALGAAAVVLPATRASAQGRCIRALGTPACDTTPIPPVFAPTGWRTAILDSVTMRVADHKAEAAFYTALMGWTLRSQSDAESVMDIGNFGTMVFRQTDEFANAPAGRGNRPATRAVVESFCFGIEPWNAKTVEAELRKRGLNPVADNRAGGFESFHVTDPDGWDLQVSNGNARNRRVGPATAKHAAAMPFASTGWKTVWLDHFSFSATNYKESASFYANLLGWTPTYDEGSQNECMMGDVGDIIIRGGNVLSGAFGRTGGRGGRGGDSAATAGRGNAAPAPRRASIDHISFGITPWDTDGVKAELEKRGLVATVDTSTGDDIHVAAFKSYHTYTPNGYNLQISYVTHDNRLALPNAVRPRAPGGAGSGLATRDARPSRQTSRGS